MSLKDEWIIALRSNKYDQTTSHLRDAYGYCCLGVACDIGTKKGIGKWVGGRYYELSGDWYDINLPPVLCEAFNVDMCGTLPFMSRGECTPETLIGLNDGGLTFEEIADVIEHFL